MLLDIVVILMLSMTVVFCWRLNRKIVELKDSRKDLKNLVQALDNSILQTHKSLASLKEASSTAASQLDAHTKLSKELVNDLSFMNGSASKLADRLESAISRAKIVIQEDILAEEEQAGQKISSTSGKVSNKVSTKEAKDAEKPKKATSTSRTKRTRIAKKVAVKPGTVVLQQEFGE
ncbi:DUF6468 domain-containing protein [Candidatus Lariskella endosymbiont of Hedychridium roseum]|uniref:DUF6468 domain-containing protein n=1 Tax=Candidatus Lariskella endosymbiont of Hedychridium roseum TaxID=3077949 RepID=UPI0030D5DFF8